MARTAPDVETAATGATLSFRFIDASGDQRTLSFRADAAATPAEIEAMADALGAATNAVLYAVEQTLTWRGSDALSGATDAAKSGSVYDNIVALYTDYSNDRSVNLFVPAPVAGLFVGATDNPDPADPLWVAIEAAFANVKFGAPTLRSLRYSERREINQRVKI